MDRGEWQAADDFGIPHEYAERVYENYLMTDVPEDGWWIQPFGEWLESNFTDWPDYRTSILGGP